MVNPFIIKKSLKTELDAVNDLISNVVNGDSPKAKRRTRSDNGFLSRDLWMAKYKYSQATVNKYRGVLYGEEMFLPNTAHTNGHPRWSKEIAEKLQDAKVPTRNRGKKVKPTPRQKAEIRSEELTTLAANANRFTLALTKAVQHHGTDTVFDLLCRADKFVRSLPRPNGAG